jgi:hypothetical protein
VVLHLAEVLPAQTEQRRAVDLGVAADVVVDAGMEGLAVLVVPGYLRLVLVLDEDGPGAPVVLLAWEVAAPLEQEDFLAGRHELVGKRPPAGAGADDDDVVVGGHGTPPWTER